jgi:hypothetical protein
MTHEKSTGTRAEVWHGTAKHTSGGLEKKDLLKNKHGRIVSKKKHHSEKKSKRLVKAGYGTKKGKFGFVLLGKKKGGRTHNKRSLMLGRSRAMYHMGGQDMNGDGQMMSDQMKMGKGGRRSRAMYHMGGKSRRRRGGNGTNYALSPSEVSGMAGTTASNPSTGVQFAAGMGN